LVGAIGGICGPWMLLTGKGFDGCAASMASILVLGIVGPLIAFLIELVFLLNGISAISVINLVIPLYISASMFTIVIALMSCIYCLPSSESSSDTTSTASPGTGSAKYKAGLEML